ncbi:MAG: lipopolysaccharide biosynthesis regulator YciM [Bermanella sp.]|jgi:lipopolysaccharide biosynthesis regulator YciM
MFDLSLLIFLVLAVAAGWMLGRYQIIKQQKSTPYASIDILGLDRQSDTMQAILNMAQREEAVELQLNLGTFYRRRGELDKAISIHQSLFARPDLDKILSEKIQLALASDYINAGLFDRAERLLLELIKCNSTLKSNAINKLVTLYEEAHDWENILKLAGETKQLKDNKAIAYACCELADKALKSQDWRAASKLIERALKLDSKCIKAILLKAKMAGIEGFPKKMVAIYKEALSYDSAILQLVLPQLQKDLVSRHRPEELERLLEGLWYESESALTLHAYVRHLAEHSSTEGAISQLIFSIGQVPTLSGFNLLFEILLKKGEPLTLEYMEHFQRILTELSDRADEYLCQQCGYESDKHYWRCPSCKQWETLTPRLAHTPSDQSALDLK